MPLSRSFLVSLTRGVVIALAIAAAGTPTLAQQTVRILTPTADTCRAYTAATAARDQTALVGLAGWVVGYLSGFAQGSRTDFLHNEDVARLSKALYEDCLKRPEMPLSIAAHELAKKLIAGRRVR
jgi:hypothetical protein